MTLALRLRPQDGPPRQPAELQPSAEQLATARRLASLRSGAVQTVPAPGSAAVAAWTPRRDRQLSADRRRLPASELLLGAMAAIALAVLGIGLVRRPAGHAAAAAKPSPAAAAKPAVAPVQAVDAEAPAPANGQQLSQAQAAQQVLQSLGGASSAPQPDAAQSAAETQTGAGAAPIVAGTGWDTNDGTQPSGSVSTGPREATPGSSWAANQGAVAAVSVPAAPPASAAVVAWPVVGPITQPFGVPELGVGTPHTGIDIGANAGTPIRAAASGRIAFVGGDPCCSYGYYVDIDHGNGVTTRYGHMLYLPALQVGQTVHIGDIIGLVGSTGFSTGPHLHFEVRLNGMVVNPALVLPRQP